MVRAEKVRAGKQLQERDRQTDRQTDRQKTNERFFNFINGISTILFYIQPSGKKRQKATTKTIESKIIVNSKQIIITIDRDRGGQTNKQTQTDRRERETYRQTRRQTGRNTERERERQRPPDRQTGSQVGRQKEAGRQIDRQVYKEGQTGRHRHRSPEFVWSWDCWEAAVVTRWSVCKKRWLLRQFTATSRFYIARLLVCLLDGWKTVTSRQSKTCDQLLVGLLSWLTDQLTSYVTT